MQRQEMIAQMVDMLGEASGGQGAPAKFRLSYHLNRAADYIASTWKCLYGLASANIVQNQVKYSSPASTAESSTQVGIIEITAVTAYDSIGNLHTMQMRTIQQMDSDYPGWRQWVAGTCPLYAVTLGLNSFLLTPAPGYNSNFDPTYVTPGGYTVEGLAVPAHSWDAPTAECPLPTIVHPAVVDLACLYRIAANPSKDNIARRPLIQQSYQDQTDSFESTILRYTQATRVPAYTREGNAGANPGYGSNPLDL